MSMDNPDEPTNELASIEWWKANLIKQEYSEGEPMPEPETGYQAPAPTTPILERLVPLKHIPGLALGALLIGTAIGMAIEEYIQSRKER
jgi:hypothetical protein